MDLEMRKVYDIQSHICPRGSQTFGYDFQLPAPDDADGDGFPTPIQGARSAWPVSSAALAT
jgi:hypothetical protein